MPQVCAETPNPTSPGTATWAPSKGTETQGRLTSCSLELSLLLLMFLLVCQAHLHHVIVIFQKALQLLTDSGDTGLKPLMPSLHLADTLEIRCGSLQQCAAVLLHTLHMHGQENTRGRACPTRVVSMHCIMMIPTAAWQLATRTLKAYTFA